MNIESELESNLSCKICNKIYASMSSLCNHNKKFHSKVVIQCNTILTDNNTKVILNEIKCNFCNRIFNNRQNKWKHEKICKNNNNNSELEIKKIELEKIKEEKEILKLKIKLQNNNSTSNTTNNNNGTINNITNNIKIKFCGENINRIRKSDKKAILDCGYLSIIKLIEVMHLNKDYPEFQNIKIHNLKDNFAKIYDELTDTFTTVNKKDSIDNLICSRTYDLKEIHRNLSIKNNNFHECVLKLINKIESCNTTIDKKKLAYYKGLQNEIILLIYNKTKIIDGLVS
jgi:hypothetical protein